MGAGARGAVAARAAEMCLASHSDIALPGGDLSGSAAAGPTLAAAPDANCLAAAATVWC